MRMIPLRAFGKLFPWGRETLLFVWNLFKSIRSILNNLFTLPQIAQIANDDTRQSSTSLDPPPFDPSQPSEPVSFPIIKLEDLESRSYFRSFHFSFNKASVPLQSVCASTSLPNRPRVLVCHDMAGGYTDDKWVQGGPNSEAYAIWHWYLIDVFVYFSHNLVTLPPPCWTNAAHKHGVKVLGTFITEWDEGRVICNRLLSTDASAQMYSERLTELAVALGFDGWLINMEVKLDLVQIPILKEFVSHLAQTMHSSVPGSLVIWYDSVTINGDLDWQNQLNLKNKAFFDICDGIFVNYTWKEDYPKLSAVVAGDRKFDVYMGIDVFGRGSYGGGQWNTNVALDVLRRDAVSAAIFAPGWVYETKQPPDFQTAQNRWWALVEKSWGILQNYPRVTPFYSNFDQGHGYRFYVDGAQVSDSPWFNISSQSFQPFLEYSEDTTSDPIRVLIDYNEASYAGGGNITFKGTLADNGYFITRLFMGKLLVGNSPLYISYSVKSVGNSLLGLSLEFSSTTKETTKILLASYGGPLFATTAFASKFSAVIMPIQVTKPEISSGWVIQESSITMEGYTLTQIHAVCYRSKAKARKLRSDLNSQDQLIKSEYYSALGHIRITNPAQNSDFPPSTFWVVEGQYIKWAVESDGSKSLCLKLTWKLKDGPDSLFPKHNIYAEKEISSGTVEVVLEYLGVAEVGAFYVSKLAVPFGISSVKFIIQVCGVDGSCQNLNESPSFQLGVEG